MNASQPAFVISCLIDYSFFCIFYSLSWLLKNSQIKKKLVFNWKLVTHYSGREGIYGILINVHILFYTFHTHIFVRNLMRGYLFKNISLICLIKMFVPTICQTLQVLNFMFHNFFTLCCIFHIMDFKSYFKFVFISYFQAGPFWLSRRTPR